MKTLSVFSKITVIALSVLLILVNVGLPLMMTFTTNDRSPSIGFFLDNFISFLPFAPILLLLLFPMLALKSYAGYKLNDLNFSTLKKHLFVLACAEGIAAVLTIMIIISANSGNAVSLF